MGTQKINNERSDLMECIRDMVDASPLTRREIAEKAGLTEAQLHDFLKCSKGTQLVRAERIIEAMGYLLSIKKARSFVSPEEASARGQA